MIRTVALRPIISGRSTSKAGWRRSTVARLIGSPDGLLDNFGRSVIIRMSEYFGT